MCCVGTAFQTRAAAWSFPFGAAPPPPSLGLSFLASRARHRGMSRTFEVVYNKLAAKKKKFDGILKVNTVTRAATLYNEDGGVVDQDSTIRRHREAAGG